MIKIVSGGQTGADRGALDAAIDEAVEHGGWCPRGRRAEDGRVPEAYRLKETPDSGYLQRTEWNIRDSDLTCVLHQGTMGPGTKATLGLARRLKKPCHEADIRNPLEILRLIDLIKAQGHKVVNFAGPRETVSPGVQEQVRGFVRRVLRGLK